MYAQLLDTLAEHELEKMSKEEMEEIIYHQKLETFESMTEDEVIAYIIDNHGLAWFDYHGYKRPEPEPA